MEQRSIKLNSTEVFYFVKKRFAARGTIFFCHGLTADHTLFDHQIEYFGREYNLISWDMPLHGQNKDFKDFSFENTCRAMEEILKAEHLKSAAIAGQSGGGYIAQTFARMYPDLIDAFIGIDTTPFGEKYYKKSELFWLKHYSAIASLYPFEAYCRASADNACLTIDSKESFYSSLKAMGKPAVLFAAQSYYDELLCCYKDPVEFKCPVILVIGEKDKTGYVKKYMNLWAEDTSYPLYVIEAAAHNSCRDNPEQFNRLADDFLKNVL